MKWIDRYNKNLCCLFIVIYFFAGLLTSIWGVYSSDIVYKSVQNVRYAFYWMNPRYAFIQATNNMLFLGGFISCCFGSLLKINNLKNKSIEILIFCNIFNTVACIFSTWLYLLIMHKYKGNTTDFNIFSRSLQSFTGFYLYICFWSFFGHKLRFIIGNKIIAIIIMFSDQILELFVIQKSKLMFLLQFLPTTLSRELVIKQFPFWIEGTWIYKLKVFSYANVTPVLNNHFQPKNLNPIWIYSILIIYMVVVSIISYNKARRIEKQ
jgi:hypothetical protein